MLWRAPFFLRTVISYLLSGNPLDLLTSLCPNKENLYFKRGNVIFLTLGKLSFNSVNYLQKNTLVSNAYLLSLLV